MQIWIHDNKMKKIVALNNDIPDMMSYTNSSWHSYLDQATSTFDFTIPKFSNGELHEDLKFINDECFVSFYVNGSYQVFYIATLQEDDFNIQLTCNNTNLEYALEYANPFNSSSAQSIQWYLEHMDLLSFAAVQIGNNEISDRKRTLTFDSQETKMNRLQSLMSKFEAEFEFKVELNRDGTYKRIVINIYQEADDTHHGIGTDRKDVVLYYSNGLKGVQVSSDKTQMFNAGVFDGKDGVNLANVEFSEKNADGVEEFYSRKGDIFVYAPLSMQRYPATMRPDGQDNWIRKDFQTEYENVNDLKAYALRTLKKYAYPLVTYTASVQSGFVSHYTDLKLGDTIRIIDKNFVGGLALEARVSEMIISFDNPANNSFVFTNYRKLDNKPSSALQTRIEQAVESKLPYRIELATTGGVTFKNNEGETIVKPSLYKGNLPWTKDVTWRWALDGVVTVGMQYLARAENIDGTAVLTVSAYVGNNEVATTEITLTDVNDGDDGVGVESIDRYFTSSDQSDGVTIEGAEWSDKPPAPTEDGKYLWAYDEITYTDGTVTTTKPAAVGANFDVDAFRAEIAEDLKDVPNREEFENKIAEELATSKAEIETQIESAKTQAENNAKEYADTINQETANVAELANAAADEIKADLVNVKNNLTSTSLVANNAQAAVDAAKQDLANVTSDLNTAKQDLANSVAEVNTKVDSAKAELTQAKQELTTVSDDLSKAKTDFQNAVSAVDTKATNLKSDLTQAKQDLANQAQRLQEQATAQSELTNRVSSVEETANGTKTTVSELSKTVAQNGKDITSVTARTKVVEDDLAGTKTTLSQVKTTADSTSQKTATLETGLNGLTAKFNSLSVGGANLFKGSRDFSGSNWIGSAGAYAEDYQGVKIFKKQTVWGGVSKYFEVKTGEEYVFSAYVKSSAKADRVTFYLIHSDKQPMSGGLVSFGSTNNRDLVDLDLTDEYQRIAIKIKITKDGWIAPRLERSNTNAYLFFGGYKLERGNIATDYSPNEADIEQKVAEYKQTADQNYASLSSTVQTLDGQVQSNKTTAEQTAQGFSTRIESLETYKDGESERANAYFESAKTETAKQLTAERTAIANNYVAKSTYTSDVTGIRNELSATTSTANATKTNLANYQASNDKMVASLKSSLQTTDGNVSNLQTKVEAVPGQITSAVSAVEGKIPTSVGSTNLLLYSADPSKAPSGYYDFTGTQKTSETYNGSVVYRVQSAWNGLQINLGNVADRGLLKVGDVLTYSVAMRADQKTPIQARLFIRYTNQSDADSPTGKIEIVNLTADWQYISVTFTVTAKMLAENTKVTFLGWELTSNAESGKYVYYACNKVERGNVATGYSPAPEDAIEEISSLSSQIQQTADGMTLLATKTELNTAKSDLQSGINTATNKANSAQNTANSNAQTISTHTTQISALNTGLQAKVSQTDFNTLSGRVTTAENNITAKANELSSKITSVESKIPTEIGAVNLFKGTRDFSGTGWIGSAGVYAEDYQGVKIFKKQTVWGGVSKYFEVKTGEEYVFSAYVKSSAKADRVTFYLVHESKQPMATGRVEFGSDNRQNDVNIGLTDKYQRIAVKIKITKDGWIAPRIERSNSDAYLFFGGYKLERGNIATDWTPAPEDTISQIDAVSSELKQTKDGITLLATKTELNTAKNDLQSGINTATNKANAAQNTANSAQNTANNNAQTISTHTTQISALNTGLQAKVSQSEFNTLSGRVTTAENNIIAKANELTSKITSVEGKIPTEIGAVNLFKGSRDFSGTGWIGSAGVYSEDYKGVKIFKKQTIWEGCSREFEAKIGEEYVFSAYVKSSAKTDRVTFYLPHPSKQPTATGLVGFDSANRQNDVSFDLTDKYKRIAIKIKITKDGWIAPRIERYNTDAYLFFGGYKLERGNIATDWTPAPEDYDSKLATAQSEFKQTTDAIKASVSSLDNSTVKSSSLTINADGIVMKAGKSTTDVANAIGSYFAVNQNAINLFSDKINVKGNMIVSGAITSDKIASKQINTAHLNGKIITADVIATNAITADAIKAGAVTTDKMSANSINGDRITAGTLDAAKIKAGSISASQIASGTLTSGQIKAGAIKSINIEASAITADKIAANSISSDKIVASGITANVIKGGTLQSLNGSTNFELDTGKLFYNNNNTGVFRVQDGASTMGLKFSNTSISVNGTNRILSRAILGGDRRESTLDDGKWDKGGFSGLVIETIKGAIPAVNEHADSLRAISDTIYFTHTYSADEPNGVSAHGWKMETYAPDSSYSGNIVLKPYGINYRQSDIVVGDIRLDNGDGSGYWMRATINTLKACFGHILNGGVSSSALNAIRSELDKISGT